MPAIKKQAPPERIQKLLARAGLGSRREIESWIRVGRITINGRVANLGDRASESDRIKIDRHVVKLTRTLPASVKVLAYYKPEGEVVTRKDPEGRRTVYVGLPDIKRGKWTAIGRLDINSSGLLLFTTDGELANKLMHPSANIEREYAVRVMGQATEEQLRNMLSGVKLSDGMARFASITDSGGRGLNHWYHVVIMEGRNREVRRLWETQGLVVNRLIRVRYGPCLLPRRKRQGQFWDLTKKEIKDLQLQAGLSKKVKSEK